MLSPLRISQSEFDQISHANKTSSTPTQISKEIIGFDCTCPECDKEFFSRFEDVECFDCCTICKCRPIHGFFKTVEIRTTTCLLCGEEISSPYLSSIFSDDRTYQLACMITHYRHDHVRYYNNSVGYVTSHTNVEYEDYKTLVNERAKRQILRKAKGKLVELGFKVEHFLALRNTDEKTIKLAKKVLGD